MSYVPGHLDKVTRQYDGWPRGVSEESKAWVVNVIKESFAKYDRPLSLGDLHDMVYDRERRVIPEDIRFGLWDYSLAVVHRGLLAADAKEMWVLPMAHTPQFYTQDNIGDVKYVVNFHDGVKKNKDGSPFFDIRTFKNKKLRDAFCNELKRQNYTAK